MSIVFQTDHHLLQQKYEAAKERLQLNLTPVYSSEQPVLLDGGIFAGIWLEDGPHENTIYGMFEPAASIAAHRVFFNLQREDGLLPSVVTEENVIYAMRPDGTGPGYREFLRVGKEEAAKYPENARIICSQVQTVIPVAATALEAARLTGDQQFLEDAYRACSAFDAWIAKYRNTRGTGLFEVFCEFDTGHDHSPRFKGLPKSCPGDDSRICPDAGGLPYLAPDMSAMLYGGRKALAEMAGLLGKPGEKVHWEEKAEATREAIFRYCFHEEDVFFYDLDRNNRFIRIKGDVITRVLSEHVVDQALFEKIFQLHIVNPEEFWTPYPLPSIAVNDPCFPKSITHENLGPLGFGGPSLALTALRTPRWLEYYKKPAHLGHIMKRWLDAIMASTDFMCQLNPFSGEFAVAEGYSAPALMMVDFVPRLYGVRLEDGKLEWNCRRPEGASCSRYSMDTSFGTAEIESGDRGSVLSVAGKPVLKVEGKCRVITDRQGTILKAEGTELETEYAVFTRPDGKNARCRIPVNGEVLGTRIEQMIREGE